MMNEEEDSDRQILIQWAKRSRAGEVCGIVGCGVPPERFCSCDMCYCTSHYKRHLEQYTKHFPETSIWVQEEA